jgi:hypothetical protein
MMCPGWDRDLERDELQLFDVSQLLSRPTPSPPDRCGHLGIPHFLRIWSTSQPSNHTEKSFKHTHLSLGRYNRLPIHEPSPLFFADARQRVKTRHETLYRCSRAWVVLAQAADSIVIMIPVPGSVRPTEARKFVSPSKVMMMSWHILGGAGILYKVLMVLQLAVRSFSQSMDTRDGLWMWSETNSGSVRAAPSRPWTAC